MLLASGASSAHHSTASYDMLHEDTIEGTVQEYQWTNPHSWLKVEAVGADGESKVWSLEFGTPSLSIRTGWKPNTFKPGDKARFIFHPRMDGAPSGILSFAILPDGKTLRGAGASGPPPGAAGARGAAPPAGNSPAP
jgi:hypothetical protein